MKKTLSTTLVIAAALAGLTAMASAQTYGNPSPTWHQGSRDQARHGSRDNGGWQQGDPRDQGQGSWDAGRQGNGSSRFRNQADITGTWRLQSRQGDVSGTSRGRGWGPFRGRGNNRMEYALPNVIQIEGLRRELQVMGPNGQSLRTIDSGRGYGQAAFTSTGGFRGATYTEFYSLQNRGRQLVIRTVVSGNRDSREFTSVYQRS